MKKIVLSIVLVATCSSLLGSAPAPKPVNVRVINKTRESQTLHIWDATSGQYSNHVQISPNNRKIAEITFPLAMLAFTRGGSYSFPEGKMQPSAQENDALKNGTAHILISSKAGQKTISIEHEQAEGEQQAQEGKEQHASSHDRLTRLEAALTAANARIAVLEDKVRKLEQQLEPGS